MKTRMVCALLSVLLLLSLLSGCGGSGAQSDPNSTTPASLIQQLTEKTYTFQVNDTSPVYECIAMIASAGDTETIKTLVIQQSSDDRALQTISIPEDNAVFTKEAVYFLDATFDGYSDLIVPKCHYSIGCFAYVYRWDPATEQFIYISGSEHLNNIAIDAENQTLLSHSSTGAVVTYAKYVYDESTDVLKQIGDIVFSRCTPLPGETDVWQFTETRIDSNSYGTTVYEAYLPEDTALWDNVSAYYVSGSAWDLSAEKWSGFLLHESKLSDTDILLSDIASYPALPQDMQGVFAPLYTAAMDICLFYDDKGWDWNDLEDLNAHALPIGTKVPLGKRTYALSNTYLPVTDERYRSLEDIRTAVLNVFTEECANRLYLLRIDESYAEPSFLEYNGALYATVAEGLQPYSFDLNTAKVVEQTEDTVIIAMAAYYLSDQQTPAVFVMSRTEAGWRLDTTIEEATTEDFLKYLE